LPVPAHENTKTGKIQDLVASFADPFPLGSSPHVSSGFVPFVVQGSTTGLYRLQKSCWYGDVLVSGAWLTVGNSGSRSLNIHSMNEGCQVTSYVRIFENVVILDEKPMLIKIL